MVFAKAMAPPELEIVFASLVQGDEGTGCEYKLKSKEQQPQVIRSEIKR